MSADDIGEREKPQLQLWAEALTEQLPLVSASCFVIVCALSGLQCNDMTDV